MKFHIALAFDQSVPHRSIEPLASGKTTVTESEKKTHNTEFSNTWWDKFITQTNSLNQPAVIKNAISQDRVESYKQSVMGILSQLGKLKTTQFGYRVYVEGRQLDFEEMEDFFERAPHDAETLEQWTDRVFGGKKFGIILNSGEKFDLKLTSEIAICLSPFFEKIGYPRGGAQFTIFVGNYDKTPLGIHQDKRGESVMHFHLGPAGKTMYVWDPKQYRDLLATHGFTKKNFNELRPYAKEYQFESGDIYYMPEGTYHIGQQDDLSIGITIWRYNHTDDHLAKHLHQRIIKQIPVEATDDFQYDTTPLDDTSGIDHIVEKYQVADEYKQLSYSELLRKTYQDWRYCVHSNAGYRNAPFPREERANLASQDLIQIEKPYKILLRESIATEKMYIYVRGHKIEFRYFSCLIPFIAKINDGEILRVDALLKLLDASWSPNIGIYILSELHRCHGIRIIDAAA
ncbi:hypothetical protein HA051_05860 [Chromobacterium vaccinii]|nr:hypothetical protein [Chromobacterium vaccinii]